MKPFEQIQESLHSIESKLRSAKHSVQLIGVTKGHPPEIYDICRKLKINHVAENKAQEYRDKIKDDNSRELSLHFIGQVQRKNLKYLSVNLYSFDALSDLEVAAALNNVVQQKTEVLLQINVAGESQKSGLVCELSDVSRFINTMQSFDKLTIAGLMVMGPTPVPDLSEKEWERDTGRVFERAHEFLLSLRKETRLELPRLSMGMSDDYEIAIACGATEIRLGSTIFGARSK